MSEKTIILRSNHTEKIKTPWGNLTWFASGKLGNSKELTAGRCVIKPGRSNPLHQHPNCSEVLTVLRGVIMHTTEKGEARMEEGDSITVPAGFAHRARNVGKDDAVLIVVFPTSDRKAENE